MQGDQPETWPARAGRVIHQGHIVRLREDDLDSPAGEVLTREYLLHPGSVAIIALDDNDRIAVVRQYRHAVRMRLVEPPAGLLDVPGEPPLAAAQRELAEEAGLAADDWRVLADFCCSPGISNEVARIFLARGLRHVNRPEGYEAHGEEVDMGLAWVPLAEVLQGVRDGVVNNAALVLGVTTLHLALIAGGVDQLRPGDAPWPLRDHVAPVP